MKQILSKKVVIGLLAASLLVLLGALIPFTSSTAAAYGEGIAKMAKKNVDQTCMQNAVDAREDAVASAFGTFNTSIGTALSARKTALHAAWSLESGTERNAALKKAWATWKTAHKDATSKLKAARKAAWGTFKSTAKTSCKETLPKEEALSADAAGSLSL